MKKAISLILSIALIFVFGLSDACMASGSLARNTDPGTLHNPEFIQSERTQGYMPHAALVMFKARTKLSKGQATGVIEAADGGSGDLSVDALWAFNQPSELTEMADGSRKLVRGASADTASREVALVTSKSLSARKLVAKLQKLDEVEYAELNYRIQARGVSQDRYADLQWSMLSTEEAPNIAYEWKEKGVTGSDNIVAVLDTGIDYTHPDLADNMWYNSHYPVLKGEVGFDFINGDSDPMDDNGHGTHCAGIIGAAGDNEEGISGVNKQIRLMALKILDAEGSAYMSHEVAAYAYINKAMDLGEPVKAINNSWGGGEYSQIFEKLVNIVGEKGAITVCAAGNDGLDNDDLGDYPANIRSPYLISVAATKEDGTLASYSNYGEETVDVAAPGNDILSTVCYDTYNPTIYDGAQQAELSAAYNGFEDSINTWAIPTEETLYYNGEVYGSITEDKPVVTAQIVPGGFLHPEGSSLQLDCRKLQANDLVCMTIPYEIAEDAKSLPVFSFMGKLTGPENAITFSASPVFGIMDVPQGTALDIETLGDLSLAGGTYFEGEGDNWSHFVADLNDELSLQELLEEHAKLANKEGEEATLDPLKRELVLLLYTSKKGDYSVLLDDAGQSRQDIQDQTAFGKYDFMSGTSMATPYVTGAVALKAAQLGTSCDPETLVNEAISPVNTDKNLAVVQKGSLDFRYRPAELGPRIGSVKVNPAKKTITIAGTGLAPSSGLKVELGETEEELQEASILSNTDKEVVIQDRGWINNLTMVRVTGFGGRQSVRANEYLVKGKKEYTQLKQANGATVLGEGMTTDGRYIYSLDSDSRMIWKTDTKDPKLLSMPAGTVDPAKIFKNVERNDWSDYAMAFANDVAYLNGYLYTVVEYGEAHEAEDDWGEFIIFSHGDRYAASGDDEDNYDGEGGGLVIYSGDFRLIAMDPATGKVKNLGKLPSDLKKTADWTLAAYNGKLYFMGGYQYGAAGGDFSKKVQVYDPVTKKWTQGKALPEARAAGKAIQSGGKLVYTMGYGAEQVDRAEVASRCPVNMIFNGSKWVKSQLAPEKYPDPFIMSDPVTRGGKNYWLYTADIGLVKGGLVYMGSPAQDLGDTYTYSIAEDTFTDTGYNFQQDIWDTGLAGTTVGSKIYGFSAGKVYNAKVASGLVKVAVKKKGQGSVSGTKSFMPGNTAKLTVKAKKGYVIKSIKVGKKTVKVKKNAAKKTVKIKNMVKNQTLTVVFKKGKASGTGKAAKAKAVKAKKAKSKK